MGRVLCCWRGTGGLVLCWKGMGGKVLCCWRGAGAGSCAVGGVWGQGPVLLEGYGGRVLCFLVARCCSWPAIAVVPGMHTPTNLTVQRCTFGAAAAPAAPATAAAAAAAAAVYARLPL